MSKETLITACICQLALQEVPQSTIGFFKRVAPLVITSNGKVTHINQSQAAELATVTPLAAATHLKRLCDAGVLIRYGRTKWGMSPNPVTHPLLRKLLK